MVRKRSPVSVSPGPAKRGESVTRSMLMLPTTTIRVMPCSSAVMTSERPLFAGVMGMARKYTPCTRRMLSCACFPLPGESLRLEFREVGRPSRVVGPAEVVQGVPTEDAACVAVVEANQYAVVAGRLERGDANVAFAGNQHLLSRAKALHFGDGRVPPEVFTGKSEPFVVVETDLEDARGRMQDDIEGTRAGHGPVALAVLRKYFWGQQLFVGAASAAMLLPGRSRLIGDPCGAGRPDFTASTLRR